MLVELALVDIPYESDFIGEFWAKGKGFHLCYMQALPLKGEACNHNNNFKRGKEYYYEC